MAFVALVTGNHPLAAASDRQLRVGTLSAPEPIAATYSVTELHKPWRLYGGHAIRALSPD
jgi:hypothetical protein